MKRIEYDQNGLWRSLSRLEEILNRLVAVEDGQNLDDLLECQSRTAYIYSMATRARDASELMFPAWMDEVTAELDNAIVSFGSALDREPRRRGAFVNQALEYLHSATRAVVGWPMPDASGSIDGDYLERIVDQHKVAWQSQRRDIRDTRRQLEALESQIQQVSEEFTRVATVAQEDLSGQRARVDAIVSAGNETISQLSGRSAEALSEVSSRLINDFQEEVSAEVEAVRELRSGADDEYKKLRQVVQDYEQLVQADSASRLAGHYELQAEAAGAAGKKAYKLAYILLGIAALPLGISIIVTWLAPHLSTEADSVMTTALISRLTFAAVVAGISALAIRRGVALFREESDYMRLALELRTMGPFLANVSDPTLVDTARLELVDRTFGRKYAAVAKEDTSEKIPVGVLQEVFALVSRTLGK